MLRRNLAALVDVLIPRHALTDDEERLQAVLDCDPARGTLNVENSNCRIS